MSIADKLTQLTNIRSNIRQKLSDKGVAASDHDFKDFATDIESIQTGITPTGSITINENGTYDVSEKAEAVVNVQSDVPDTLGQILDGSLVWYSSHNNPVANSKVFPSACRYCRYYSVKNRNGDYYSARFFDGFGLATSKNLLNWGIAIDIIANALWNARVYTLVNMATKVNRLTGSLAVENNHVIYVRDSLVDGFKVATNWSQYADKIKGLSESPVYDDSITYEIGDAVHYNNKFYTYWNLDASSGNAPTGTNDDNAHWEYVLDCGV